MANKKSNKTLKNIEKYAKKISPLKLFVLFTCFLVGVGAGIGTTYFLTRNDKFELKGLIDGKPEITINVGQTYNEPGAVCIAFGKDISDKVKIENNLDINTEGIYVIKYTVDNLRFNGYTLYRQITVKGVEE